jgi:hypothetical protein
MAGQPLLRQPMCGASPRPSFSSQSVICCIAPSALNIGLHSPALETLSEKLAM